MPIPACYCALHATEEAVAAFISCAKELDYGDDAKINIRDHQAKATVSLIVQIIVKALRPLNLAIAFDPKSDAIIARYDLKGEQVYAPAKAELLCFLADEHSAVVDFFDYAIQSFGGVTNLTNEVKRGQDIRNKIFYASNDGVPTGFIDPVKCFERECQVSLSLIWACIDMSRNNRIKIPIISQALRTANIVIKELKG